VINAVHKAAPAAAIAFNTRPEDSADAAPRWLDVGLCSECGARWPDISITIEPVSTREIQPGYVAGRE
jgi:hypothetical protein